MYCKFDISTAWLPVYRNASNNKLHKRASCQAKIKISQAIVFVDPAATQGYHLYKPKTEGNVYQENEPVWNCLRDGHQLIRRLVCNWSQNIVDFDFFYWIHL